MINTLVQLIKTTKERTKKLRGDVIDKILQFTDERFKVDNKKGFKERIKYILSIFVKFILSLSLIILFSIIESEFGICSKISIFLTLKEFFS